MRIGLNLLYLIPGIVGGTETYAVSLIKALAAIDRENEYFIFLNLESADLKLTDAPNFRHVVCKFRATRRTVRYAWEQFVLPWQLRRCRMDLVHSLGYVGPLASPCRSIVTVPDLNYIALQGVIPSGKRRVLQFFSTQATRRSTHVITISNFSKAEIMRVLGITADQVTVTHLGPGWNTGAPIPWDSLKECYALPEHYVVAFGGKSAHKNISRLILAFGQACTDLPHRLVLVGRLPPGMDLARETSDAGLPHRVVALGYVSNTHISSILGHADLFVLPSLYEGFGMPVLEAQQAGVPVACSTAGSLPEVAGEGAVFFDPLSSDDMARVIRECLSDLALCTRLRRMGTINVQRFSWDKAARETLAVYRQVASCGS